jgi:hypothetical protein
MVCTKHNQPQSPRDGILDLDSGEVALGCFQGREFCTPKGLNLNAGFENAFLCLHSKWLVLLVLPLSHHLALTFAGNTELAHVT